MCSAGLALGLVGGYASYAGTKLQSKAQEAQYAAQAQANEYSAIVADNNAKIAEMQAKDAVLRGEQKKVDLSREVGQVRGAGRAGYAAGNVQVGTGSAMTWEQDLSAGAARERVAIDRNTDLEQWGFKVQAQNERNQAGMARMGAANATAAGSMSRSAGGLAATSSLLSTAKMFADQFDIPGTRSKKTTKGNK